MSSLRKKKKQLDKYSRQYMRLKDTSYRIVAQSPFKHYVRCKLREDL